MGIKRMGPPVDVILQIKEILGLNCFVETGTFKGDTALWASDHFESVVTIENSQEIYQETKSNLSGIPNIDFRFGHTLEQLGKLLPEMASAGIFWLDAHWCGGASYGQQDECPILDEIQIINASPYKHCILIDDARLFLEPPPAPHDVESWPEITTLLELLNEKKGRYTVIRDDVIITVPDTAKAVVQNYCRATQPIHSLQEKNCGGISLAISGLRRFLFRDL